MIPNPVLRKKLDLIMRVHQISEEDALAALKWLSNPTIRPIVGIREFINSPYYMNANMENGKSAIYEKVMWELEQMNNGDYSEAVLTGSIGAAKTTCALYTTAYQLYILSCYSSPHALYELDPASEIVFVFQSLNAAAARRVDYERFKSMIENAPYFQEYFKFDKELTSELHFPNRIIVRPVSGSETAAIGQNVFGGIIDEVNFMAQIEGGKNAGEDGVYDQAVALYNSISKRRKSRFGVQGKVPGMLCIVSSRRYPGQFTDIKEEEAAKDIAKYGRSPIYVYDKRTWEIKPDGSFMKEMFKVFIGDDARRPRILAKDEHLTLGESYDGLVMDIPMDFIDDFERDMLGSLRDIAGVATLAKHPFIVNRESIRASMRKDNIAFQREKVDFAETQLSILASQFYKPELPRFFHCDLAITGDSAGFAIGTVIGFKSVSDVVGAVEMLPIIHIDALLEIAPPKGGEIKLFKVRDIIHTLRKLGLNVRWGTFDQFQSRDSMQLLKQSGLSVGYQSVDTTMAPYDFLKNAMYDGRLSMPEHHRCAVELASLEKLVQKKKIDHPPGGCFTGETRVALANGTNPTFKELGGLYPNGEEFFVYSMSGAGIRIAPARNPRITKVADTLVEVELDNFQVIRCTPDHLFMTLDQEWVRADSLTPDISIMPLYRSVSYKGGTADYERVWCPVNEVRILTHHLSAGAPIEGSVVHHVDENKRNNDPRNLEHLTKAVHHRHHGYERWEKVKDAMKAGFNSFFANEEARQASRDRITKSWEEGKFGPPRAPCSIEGCDSKANARGSCDKHYQKAKRDGKLPERSSKAKNHRVLSVRHVTSTEEVYDLTVPGFENFALSSGVFVHNSKDVSDALAGVVYGLTMRREIWALHGISSIALPTSVKQAIEKEKTDKLSTKV